MKPKTLSASSLKSAAGCLSRFYAENMMRTASRDNVAAQIGTATHGGLEAFVKATKLPKEGQVPMPWDFSILETYYMQSYTETFGTSDYTTEEYKDGLQMTQRWFDRTGYLQNTEVISAEVKSNFPVKTSAGEIPVTYIWDRCDRLDESTVKVVDYKTIRGAVSASDLRRMIQPRLYAVAAQIQFPWATKIWVEFDLLRFDAIGTVFSIEENRDMYKFIKREAERILAANEQDLPETLNADCRFCVRKADCQALKSNTAGGGVLDKPIFDIVKRKAEIDAQTEALKWLAEELDEQIMKYADAEGTLDFSLVEDGLTYDVNIKGSLRRSIEAKDVRDVIGPELSLKYGNLGVTQVDKLLKSDEIDEGQKARLNALMGKTYHSPKAHIKKRDL